MQSRAGLVCKKAFVLVGAKAYIYGSLKSKFVKEEEYKEKYKLMNPNFFFLSYHLNSKFTYIHVYINMNIWRNGS